MVIFVTGGNGYLIPVGDADVMADRMLALMEDKNLEESFSKESVKIREELTDDRIFWYVESVAGSISFSVI